MWDAVAQVWRAETSGRAEAGKGRRSQRWKEGRARGALAMLRARALLAQRFSFPMTEVGYGKFGFPNPKACISMIFQDCLSFIPSVLLL